MREYWIVDPVRRQIYVFRFEKGAAPEIHPFESSLEIGISGGRCVIDFERISRRLSALE